ncbi:hypothetical protein BpHYR1_004078 [Brachionus plicatilis]|uniref:Uncharacterized protein n=1 Tax=Brachionus plicatilis TaxID=10195 RepID=A0A3M7PSN2_BRAPC|nr:hypothetical protein BpHYR1_004078 [Brachionus plicatilis]
MIDSELGFLEVDKLRLRLLDCSLLAACSHFRFDFEKKRSSSGSHWNQKLIVCSIDCVRSHAILKSCEKKTF